MSECKIQEVLENLRVKANCEFVFDSRGNKEDVIQSLRSCGYECLNSLAQFLENN